MPVKDLRTFLQKVDDEKELIRVKKEVDSKTQMGALFTDAGKMGKAVLFENVKGHPDWRVVGELLTTRKRQAIALETTQERLLLEYVDRLSKPLTKCKIVSSGPVKEKVFMGDEVDLNKIPVLIHCEYDAGPYIGSGICVTKDPETGIQNESIMRLQVKGKNRTGIMIGPQRHSWLHLEKYEKMNKPMPITMVIGHYPLLDLACTTVYPYGVDHFDAAGTILGEPLAVTKCETSDLNVPAHAEIVLEGEIQPKFREYEGPFAEFSGQYGDGNYPVIQVKAITMREDAIYRHIQTYPPPCEHFIAALPIEALIYQRVKDVDAYVDLKDVHVPSWGGMWTAIVKFTPHFDGQAKNILLAMMSTASLYPKIVIVVDEDVDIHDPADVQWAISTRVNPATDIITVTGTRNHPMDLSIPLVTPPDADMQRVGGKIGIDATKPPTWRADEREKFKRIRPMGWNKFFLKDFL
ncbi:MAG: UbiD family decarboxylase [Methanobacteriota archaeon]